MNPLDKGGESLFGSISSFASNFKSRDPMLPTPPGFGDGTKKPKAKSPVATYLGPNATPTAANAGMKTLIGT